MRRVPDGVRYQHDLKAARHFHNSRGSWMKVSDTEALLAKTWNDAIEKAAEAAGLGQSILALKVR